MDITEIQIGKYKKSISIPSKNIAFSELFWVMQQFHFDCLGLGINYKDLEDIK